LGYVADVNETSQDRDPHAEDRDDTTDHEPWPAFTANQSRTRI
jgi:hypothetical protein